MMLQLKPLKIIYTCTPSHCFMKQVEELARQIPVVVVNNQNEKMNVDAVELIIQSLAVLWQGIFWSWDITR